MDDVTATPVQDAAQVIKGTANIDVRDVNMPVFMGLKRLNETAPLFGGFTIPAPDQICRTQNTINAAGTDCNNILVEHHKGQTPIPFQPMVEVEVNNSPLLTVLQPKIDKATSFLIFPPIIYRGMIVDCGLYVHGL